MNIQISLVHKYSREGTFDGFNHPQYWLMAQCAMVYSSQMPNEHISLQKILQEFSNYQFS